jgi:hypothetical protein
LKKSVEDKRFAADNHCQVFNFSSPTREVLSIQDIHRPATGNPRAWRKRKRRDMVFWLIGANASITKNAF